MSSPPNSLFDSGAEEDSVPQSPILGNLDEVSVRPADTPSRSLRSGYSPLFTNRRRGSTVLESAEPPQDLIDAFEELSFDDGSAQIRKIRCLTGRKLPYLLRNMMSVFEDRVRSDRDLRAEAAGFVDPPPLIKERVRYGLGHAQDEEITLTRRYVLPRAPTSSIAYLS